MKYRLALCALLACSAPAFAGNEDANLKPPFPSPRHSGEGRIAFSSSNVQLLGWKVLTDFPGGNTSGNDCWGYTSPSGREYALMGLSGGTGFVEVTDPGNPVIVTFKSGAANFWRCLKTYQGYAYAGSEGGGNVQVFNMTSIDSGVVTVLPSVGGTCSSVTHTLALDPTSGFLYRAGGSTPCNGLQIYDLANPAAPVLVGQWNTGRYVHECQVETWDVPGPFLGKQIAFCYSEDNSGGLNPRLQILDVTNKAAITVLSTTPYGGAQFSHQGWTSADKRYVYLDDEADAFGTRIFDIADLAAPSYLGFFANGAVLDHNLYVVGNRIYEGNYRSGLRIFDNTVPTAPTSIGFFDTCPESDAVGFNSLWSNYPFFASGTILGGDIERGLFVWRFGPRKLVFGFPNGNPELIGPAGFALQFEIDEDLAGELQGGTERLHYSTGGAFTDVPATWLGGHRYEALLPAEPCGQKLEYYVSAQSNDGVTWTDPPAGPTQVYTTVAAYDESVAVSDTMETATAWVVNAPPDLRGHGVAFMGSWVRGDPIGTAAQPEDDHTNPGVNCWFTGQGSAGGAVGEADVDDGTTTLRSPPLDATGLSDPYVSYWRWYSDNQTSLGTTALSVEINGDGVNWVTLETVGPTGPDATGGWIRHVARIADFVAPTSTVRLRFTASDHSTAVVEAAVDDLQILDYDCTPLTVATISPATGPFNGGSVVTITGTKFKAGETTVRFGPNASPLVTVLNGSMLRATVPPGISSVIAPNDRLRQTAGIVDVVVQNPGSAMLPAAYTYQPPPRKNL